MQLGLRSHDPLDYQVDGLCQLYKFPDPGGDVVGPAYVGLYGSSVLVFLYQTAKPF